MVNLDKLVVVKANQKIVLRGKNKASASCVDQAATGNIWSAKEGQNAAVDARTSYDFLWKLG